MQRPCGMGYGLLAAVALLPRLVRRFKEAPSQPNWISTDELAARLHRNEGITVIDVRGPEEYVGSMGHIAQARNVPMGDLPQRIGQLIPLADQPIVLVCRTDRRSARAAVLLAEAGVRDVRVLQGGMVQWTQMSKPRTVCGNPAI